MGNFCVYLQRKNTSDRDVEDALICMHGRFKTDTHSMHWIQLGSDRKSVITII